MSTEPITTKLATPTENRRGHHRRRVNDLAYVACGPDNGGILVDVSEGGLSFQGVGALHVGTTLQLRFVLPGVTKTLETSGEVVWSTDSKRGGGLRFVNLDGGVRQQIGQWVSAGAGSPDRKEQPVRDPHTSGGLAVAVEPLQPEKVLAIPIPAVPPSEIVREPDPDPDLKAALAGAGGQETIHAPAPRTMFADGLRRTHSVLSLSGDAKSVTTAAQDPAAKESAQKIVLKGVPERSSRGVLYILGAALGCGILLAGAVGFRALGGAGAGYGTGPAPQQSPDEANQNFQVEVVDIRNRRLILSNDGANTSASVDREAVRRVPQTSSPASVTTVPVTPIESQANAQPSRSLQDLTLQGPRRANPPSGLTVPQAPAVANLAPSIPPLDSSFLTPQSSDQPRPPQPPAEIMQLRSGLQQAVLIKRVNPAYSTAARQARVAGTVQVSATIGTDGVPRGLRLVSGDARLAGPALSAIRLWRYKPAVLNGQAIETETIVQVEFQLRP